MTQDLPRIAFIGTGGTIASVGADRFDLLDYGAMHIHRSAAEVLADCDLATPGFARVESVDFRRIDSTAITAQDWHQLAKRLRSLHAAQPDLAGIVIGHGTASIEETSYALALTHDLPIPVVMTGSMRPINGISTDAAANLAAAIRVATVAPAGVYVVLNDRIFDPRSVTKTDTLRLDAFVDRERGPIGFVNGDRVDLTGEVSIGSFDASLLGGLPRVDIALSHVGADGTAIRAFLAAGAAGIVSAGFGPGMAAPLEMKALAEAVAAGRTVVQSARVGGGPVVDGRDNRAIGLIAGGSRLPQKARILLALCLARGDSPDRIAEVFQTAV